MNKFYLLTLNLAALVLVGITAAQADSGGPDGFGYTYIDSFEPGGPDYAFEDISASSNNTLLPLLADEEMSAPQAIGFDFNYYGTNYTHVYIADNGFISFLPGQYSDWEAATLPTTGDPDAVIAAWWGDLSHSQGDGTIHTETLGTAPNRVFIVQFTDIRFWCSYFEILYGICPEDTTTHQYKLFEGTNIIEVHYEHVDSNQGSVGIEDEIGMYGFQYSYDTFFFDPVMVRYSPPVQDPDCSVATPSTETLWPPNHKFVPIDIEGVTDPSGAHILITINSIFQDEPVNTYGDGNTEPDGQGVGSSTAEVRAERSGTKKVPGDGRVYHINFTATGGQGECTGEVTVGVPHDQGKNSVIIDGGHLYDSTM